MRRWLDKGPWRFCWQSALEGLVISWVVLVALSPFEFEPRRAFDRMSAEKILLLAVVFAPVVETVLFQVIPIHCCRWFKGSFTIQVVISTALFAAAHFHENFLVGMSAGLVGGFYLAFTYAHWADKRGMWTACWTTAVHHGIRNGISVGLLLALR